MINLRIDSLVPDILDSGFFFQRKAREMALEQRYADATINRQFWLADTVIRIKSYRWGDVDKVAESLTDSDVEAFRRVVEALNKS